jgi:hypothetical protein
MVDLLLSSISKSRSTKMTNEETDGKLVFLISFFTLSFRGLGIDTVVYFIDC